MIIHKKSGGLPLRKLLFILIIGLLITGCSKGTDTTSEAEEKPGQVKETQDDDKEKDVEEDSEEADSAEAAGKLGDLEVKLSGEAMINKDQIKIEGESNLLSGTKVYSSGVNDDGFASSTFIDTAEVKDDGSFSFEFSGISKSTEVELKLYNNNEETAEHYGENLEKVTGPQKYVTDTHGEFKVKVDFYIDVDKEMPYSIPIDIPEWEQIPDDYGEQEVWMEADVESDHRYLYFHGKSNLMEGAKVGGNLMRESGIIDPFSFGHTRINPDGTFELRVPYHTLRKGMYMPIRFEPNKNSWEDIVDNYGEHGKQLTGELVEKDGEDQYAELIVGIDAPDFDPPEDVGLTVEKEEVKIQMPDDLLFDFDDSKLKSNAKDTLNDVVKDLQKLDDNTAIEINGHTDNAGDEVYNMELSKRRADAVWSYLKKQGAMDGLDVQVDGYGDTKPIASNKDKKGQERNRRVEIIINPR